MGFVMGYRILVVDDEMVIRQLIERHFTSKGHEVYSAADGKEAMDIVLRKKPDIMILDIKMPNMDGVEVLQALRKAHKEMLVMILTAYDDLSQQTFSLGACDYITKPFDLDYLEARVMTNLSVKSPFKRPDAP